MTPTDYQDMIAASVTLPEDNSRLYYALCQQSSPCNILFLGGSITQGFEPSSTLRPFSSIVEQNLTSLWGSKRTLTVHNYGYCCMNTHLAIAILPQIINVITPDIAVLEFSVNNSYDLEYAASFEGIIQKILVKNPSAAIIILCTCDENGYSCEAYMAEIARHYSFPVISLKKALDTGKTFGYTWSDYSKDNCHPCQAGQQLLADCIWELFLLTQKNSLRSALTPGLFYLPKKPCFSDSFAGAVFYPACELKDMGSFVPCEGQMPFLHLIKHKPGDARPLKLEFDCKQILILFEQINDIKIAGRVEVTSDDGKEATIVDGYTICGWDNPGIVPIMYTKKEHHHLRIQMVKDDVNRTFRIYGFLVL